MQEKPPFVLAVGSFAVHGTASLKTFISILKDKILPVPSLLLNGLTNMSMVHKFEPPFRELLESTFELAENRGLSLIFYIGYLGNGEQAGTILELMDIYRDSIKTIITDPVCGDHGRIYVPAEVTERWPAIIERSDIVFPNITELKLLSGESIGPAMTLSAYADRFTKRFPLAKLVVTSLPGQGTIGIKSFGSEPFEYMHELLPKNYGGTGDAFVALFILNYFYKKMVFNIALQTAVTQTFDLIKTSIGQESDNLILNLEN